jgi:hypothetical protein
VTIDSTGVSAEEVVSVISAVLEREDHSDNDSTDQQPLFSDIDCIQIPVPDRESGLACYREVVGHTLLWQTPTAAGLQLADSRAEIVLQTERPELEVNLSVASADATAERFIGAGAALIVEPPRLRRTERGPRSRAPAPSNLALGPRTTGLSLKAHPRSR